MKIQYPNIRAVAFDYGGVLAHFIEKEDIAKMADVAQVDPTTFDSSMWKFRHELDSGEYDNTRYWTLVLEHCNSPLPKESGIEILVEMDLKGFSRMNQGMIRWANTLKVHGFATLIISNMSGPTYQRLIAPHQWMQHFDSAVISGIIGINKPDRRIFEHAIEQVQLQAAEILFLDDLPHNVASAKESGLNALLFSNTHTLAKELTTHYPNLPIEGLGYSDT